MRPLPEPYATLHARLSPYRQLEAFERLQQYRRQFAADFVLLLRHVHEDALGEFDTRDENGRTMQRLENVARHFLDGERTAMADLRRLVRWTLFVTDFHAVVRPLTASECAARDAALRLSRLFDNNPNTEEH